jgi:hypothetical protein
MEWAWFYIDALLARPCNSVAFTTTTPQKLDIDFPAAAVFDLTASHLEE